MSLSRENNQLEVYQMRSTGKFTPGKTIIFMGLVPVLLLQLVLSGSSVLVSAQSQYQTVAEGQVIFDQQCAACHTIGGGILIGPDLQGVTQRRDMDWLQRMISAPDQLIANQDPILMPLLAEFNNLPMPNLGLTQSEVQFVLAYLENPGSVGQPQPVVSLEGGSQQAGSQYFSGTLPLANGGPNCIACHSTADLPVLGGGSLGPDLTQVAQRLGDPGLASALQTLPFPTMQGVYTNRMLTPAEQADLFAYFQAVKSITPAGPDLQLWYWGVGIAGAVVLFGLLIFYWPRQRRSLSDILRDQA
jgi:mono/diheme cytochrome c family protein